MAYEKKPGDLAVFKNDRKEKDTQPDYTIVGLTLDGRPMKGALWMKEDRNGKKFMAGKIEVDTYAEDKSRGGGGEVRSRDDSRMAGRDRDRQAFDLDDSIPFVRW